MTIMPLKRTLTNEKLNARFANPFSLVNYAIGLAKNQIMRGEGLESNPANDVLEMIEDERDQIEEKEEETIEEET